MDIKSKPYKTSIKFFYISLAIFLLSLLVVYTSSNESGEWAPSLRDIIRLFFHWFILPVCFLLSVIGCSLAAAAMGRVQYKHFILGFSLNLCMILAYGGYLWAYHSGFIYHTFEMNPRNRMKYAMAHNKLWLVRWELMKGADVNAKYDYYETLLMYSVRNRNRKLMELVLDYHPDVNVYCDIQGKSLTPLHCIAGVEEDILPNIFGGGDFIGGGRKNLSSEVLAKRMHRRMALHRLRNQDSEERRGAGVMALAPQKQPAQSTQDWDSLQAARLLLEHGAVPDLRLINTDKKSTCIDITALSLAYDNGKSDLVDLLLNCGADVNVKIKYREQTLLHAAVERSDVEMVKRLISLGAKLDIKDNDTLDGPKSPLQMAVVFEDIECAKVLIENGADVNILFSEGIGGNAPLHLAVMTGNIDMVQLLLDHYADVNSKEVEGGKTPLHLAVDFSKGKADIVKLLMEHGANPDVSAVFSDRKGEEENHTPLSLARKRQYFAVADFLLSYEAKN